MQNYTSFISLKMHLLFVFYKKNATDFKSINNIFSIAVNGRSNTFLFSRHHRYQPDA